MSDPVLVEVARGSWVESVHCGRFVVVDAAGAIVAAEGDPERPVFPRSANKPLQALPLVASGAADRFGLDDHELALACASHRGEPMHVTRVAAWLARIGRSVDALECGAHLPYHEASAAALIRAGEDPTALHNNCSGKHSGFVTTATHLGETAKGYLDPAHPTMARVTQALSAAYGVPLDARTMGIDGCGIPTFAVPLRALAHGMAKFATGDGLGEAFGAAARRIYQAYAAAPLMVSGTDEFTSLATQAMRGAAIVKIGAEGVFAGAVAKTGQGFALKIADGAGRAVETACAHLLDRLGLLDEGARATLAPWLRTPIANRAGAVVGEIRPAAWTAF